jgi:chaperonin cofactor prefoldin
LNILVVENWTKSLLKEKHEYCTRKVGVLSSHMMTKNQKLSQLNAMLNNKLV